MIAILFEVTLNPGAERDYLAHAAALRAELEGMDGFISIERFVSLTRDDKILSLSFWRDEEAVAKWRRHGAHRLAQADGRDHLFADYRISVASLMRQYGMLDRLQALPDALVAE